MPKQTLKTALEVIEQYREQMRAKLVQSSRITGTLARQYGRQHCWTVESIIFSLARRMMPAYRGAAWDFVKLADGGFYMALPACEQWQVTVEANGFDGEVSGDAAGLIVCMTAYTMLTHQQQSDIGFHERIVRHTLSLHRYIGQHPEGLNICQAID